MHVVIFYLLDLVVIIDIVKLTKVGAWRRKVVQEPSGIGYVDGKMPDLGSAVKGCPCLTLLEVDEFDTTDNMRLEEGEPVARDLEAG